MRLKKTNKTNRTTYTYAFTDTDDKGKTFIRKQTLRPGEDGVTEIDIKLLHSLDDREVYINIPTLLPMQLPVIRTAVMPFAADCPSLRLFRIRTPSHR